MSTLYEQFDTFLYKRSDEISPETSEQLGLPPNVTLLVPMSGGEETESTTIESGELIGQINVVEGFIQSANFERTTATGWRINPDGTATFKDITIATKEIVVAPGESIQDAIDELTNGGRVSLRSGTHTIANDLVVPNSVQIIGENRDTTIVDFNSTAYQFVVAGTSIYTTGTISAIGSGGTVVTGDGTSWLANVTTGHQLFIDGRWYMVAAVTTDTNIILAEPYKDAATYSGTYRAAILAQDIHFKSLTIINSTSQAINFDDVRDIRMDDLLFMANNKGFTMDYFTFCIASGVTITTSTSNGYEMSYGKFFNSQPIASQGNGGHGTVLTNIKSCAWIYNSNDGNTDDGFNCTDVDRCSFTVQTDGNGGKGIEFVSGCDDNRISIGNMNANTSDGIKLTATCDNNTITTCVIRANGGYGVNIANANCDDNVIATSHFGSNSSGAVNDSGTGTVIKSNVGVSDYPAVAGAAPPGLISPYGGASAPSGWLLCDGTTGLDSVADSTLADLYAIIGTTFGGVNAEDFDLPDMRGNFPLGKDNMGGGSRNRVTHANADTVGSEEGEETHVLTTAELAAHTHTTSAVNSGSIGGGSLQGSDQAEGYTPSTSSTGSDTAHENMPPYMTLNYIIKK